MVNLAENDKSSALSIYNVPIQDNESNLFLCSTSNGEYTKFNWVLNEGNVLSNTQ